MNAISVTCPKQEEKKPVLDGAVGADPNFEAWNQALKNVGLKGFTEQNPTQFEKYAMVKSVGLMPTPHIIGTVGTVLEDWDRLVENIRSHHVDQLHTYIESSDATFRMRQKKFSLEQLHGILQDCLKLQNGDQLVVSAIPAGEVLYNGTIIVEGDGSFAAEFTKITDDLPKNKRTPARGAPIEFSIRMDRGLGVMFPRNNSKDSFELFLGAKLLGELPKTELHGGAFEIYMPGYYEFGVIKMPDESIQFSFYDYNESELFMKLNA